ncbi:hypothetical protein CYLTODRAFT_367269 [Cylindrobasidium torrendii FP15055 ss-10]|uniref:CMP/dCMP-type deaminase domain-containing protein n=1 Tax=Cylindrobasidium torrendii FP15055 ss-10 TaxID=1314674 RepID=A0A0D7BQN9_9AGAR|nr:hypothetical protein CYLTODRAFT_367269 [Cylindrobasidium torrendii FP15055 ss-10]
MNNKKSQFYLSQCIDAALKSPMSFTLGSIIVKGGKVVSSGFNHQRTNYDELTLETAHCKAISMHAEMHAIWNLTRGRAPPFKQLLQPCASVAPKRKSRPGSSSSRSSQPCQTKLANADGRRRKGDLGREYRVSGDLYVARITKKTGKLGCAKPCWRCVEWCDWVGIKRIFHWSEEEGGFCCIKVSEAKRAAYATQADLRVSMCAHL